MTSTRTKDFLTRELFIKKNVITFRLLSRELGVHVNDAKNELAAYLAETANTDTPSFATYMISGLAPLSSNCDDQYVIRSKIIMVDGDGLQDAQLQFSRIHCVHVYSLSPSMFRDAHLICEPTVNVRDIDTKGNPALNGKIVGAHIKAKTGPLKNNCTASSSKTKLNDAQNPVVSQTSNLRRQSEQVMEKVKPGGGSKEKDSAKSLAGTKERPKLSGNLDWSKARSREQKTAGAPAKDKNKLQSNQETKTLSPSAEPVDKLSRNRDFGPLSKKKSMPQSIALEPKKVPKRKSLDPSDSDADTEDQPLLNDRRANPPGTSKARVKNGVIVSDDEDEEVSRKPRRKRSSERSFEAMMDIDDDQVIRVSRLSSHRPDDSMDDTPAEIDLSDANNPISSAVEEEEEDLKPQVKKRKPKKVIPVGRNGSKKRRVIKVRTITDVKGYMQTEDYSSYESVSEEDAVPGDAKSRGKKRVRPKLADDVREDPVQTKSKIKEANSSRPTKANTGKLPKRGGLLNFFGPDKTKK